MDELTRKFEEFYSECVALMRAKNADYGSSWELMRPESITDQILVKVMRIRQLEALAASGAAPKVSEGIESELHDIANYCVFRALKMETMP